MAAGGEVSLLKRFSGRDGVSLLKRKFIRVLLGGDMCTSESPTGIRPSSWEASGGQLSMRTTQGTLELQGKALLELHLHPQAMDVFKVIQIFCFYGSS